MQEKGLIIVQNTDNNEGLKRCFVRKVRLADRYLAGNSQIDDGLAR